MIHRPILPTVASLLDSIRDMQIRNVLFSLQEIDKQASGGVPCNVTMERPSTWVVAINLENEVGVGASSRWKCARNDKSVSAGWIFGVLNGTVPFAGALGKDKHIVAVWMLC